MIYNETKNFFLWKIIKVCSPTFISVKKIFKRKKTVWEEDHLIYFHTFFMIPITYQNMLLFELIFNLTDSILYNLREQKKTKKNSW